VNILLRRSVLASLVVAGILGIGSPVRYIQAQSTTTSVQAGATSTADSPSTGKSKPEQNEDDAYRMSPTVVELGSKLGLDPEQSAKAFEISNFLLLAVAVVWVLLKVGLPFMQIDPMPKLLRNRNGAIQKNLQNARTVTEEARARLSGVEERLSKLDAEIAAMREHAEQDSAHVEERIKAAVEDEKGKILSAAEQEITAATNHAQRQLQQYAAEMAIEQAARKLVVSAETDRLLVQGFASRLTGDESKKGQN